MYNKNRSQQQQSDRMGSTQHQFSNQPHTRFDGSYRDSMGSQNYYQGQQSNRQNSYQGTYQGSSNSAPYQQYYGTDSAQPQSSQQWQQHEVPPPSSSSYNSSSYGGSSYGSGTGGSSYGGLSYGSGTGGYHPSRSMNEGVYRSDSYSSSGMPQSSEQIGSRYYSDLSSNQQYGSGQYGGGSQYGTSQYGSGQYGSGQYSGSQYGGSQYGEHSGKGPKNYRRSEERIREDVCEALEQHGGIDASEIDVSVSEGVVTLSGTVESRQMKRLAEETIERMSGVQDVKNELKVEDSSSAHRRNMSEASGAESSRGFSSSSSSGSKTGSSTGRTSSSQASSTKQ